MSNNNRDRHTRSEAVQLITDPHELASAEARNTLLQFDLAKEMVESSLGEGAVPLIIRPGHILRLHHCALNGIDAFAGTFRNGPVEIGKSKHTPPEAFSVSEHIHEMCNYIENNNEKSPITLAAYAMWRLNWIHPFKDGNGRTSRIFSYMVLCNSMRCWLPGTKTRPELITENREPYYQALEQVDEMLRKKNEIVLQPMEKCLEALLSRQLIDIYGTATGRDLENDNEEDG